MTTGNIQIELAHVGGNVVPFERHGNNVWVNLTEMERPFGQKKDPTHWLRSKGAQEYIQAIEECDDTLSVIQKCITDRMSDVIIIRRGGIPENQGTWCTDYRVAVEYGRWLSIKFGIKVNDLLVRIASGSCLLGDGDTLELAGKRWISREEYSKSLNRPVNSFNGLKAHYPSDFLFYGGKWYVSLILFDMKEAQVRSENIRTEIRASNDASQLSLPFES